MHIGIDGRYIQNQYHGVGRYIYEVSHALAVNYTQHTFCIFHNPNTVNTLFDLNLLRQMPHVQLVETSLPLLLPQQQIGWPYLLKKHDIDLFHTPFFDAPWFAPCPVLNTIHDLIFDRYPQFTQRPYLQSFYRLLAQMGINRASHILTVSESTKQDIVDLYQVPPYDISVIPKAADPHFRPVSPAIAEQVRKRYALPQRFVLTVGTMHPQKNIPTLIHAFAKVATQTDVSLVLAGAPDRRWPDEVHPLIEQYQLQNRVHQIGAVAEADLPGLYNLAEVFALPSIIEGFGLLALEAMACGTMVLASNSSALPELIGNAGILVKPYDVEAMADGLLSILTNPSYRQHLEAQAVLQAKRFHWNRTAHLTMQTYQAVFDVNTFMQRWPNREWQFLFE